jgi:uncharacterized protein (DUF952 family)
VPYLPELGTEALELTQQIQFEPSRASALIALVPHLPESLLPQALELTQQIQDAGSRAAALIALVPHLPELGTEALELTQQIQFEPSRASALTALVPHLPESLLPQALELTRQFQDKHYSAQAFQGMADRLIQLSTSIHFWHEVLHMLSHLRRDELLQTMAKLRPFIMSLGGREALQEMIKAMNEVCRQWR